jgi:hypothetical protein
MDDTSQVEEVLADRLGAVSLSNGLAKSPLNAEICEVLGRAVERNYRIFLVGGLLRDLVFRHKAGRPRDVDFMVFGPSERELEEMYSDMICAKTSLGGLRLQKQSTKSLKTVFDVWRMEDTWAFKGHTAKVSLRAFLRTPFLNLDSVAAEWVIKHQRWSIHENGFWEGASTRTLDINHEPNPKPLLCAIRAIALARRYELRLSSRLAKYVTSQIISSPDLEIKNVQLAHFGKTVLSTFVLMQTLSLIKDQLNNGTTNVVQLTTKSRLKTKLGAVAARPRSGALSSRRFHSP